MTMWDCSPTLCIWEFHGIRFNWSVFQSMWLLWCHGSVQAHCYCCWSTIWTDPWHHWIDCSGHRDRKSLRKKNIEFFWAGDGSLDHLDPQYKISEQFLSQDHFALAFSSKVYFLWITCCLSTLADACLTQCICTLTSLSSKGCTVDSKS